MKLKNILIATGALALIMAPVVFAHPAMAIDLFPACGPNSTTSVCRATNTDNAMGIVQNVIRVLFWIIGVLSVIMIIAGGIKYVISNGDSSKIQSAKNTIMYAVIGLVVAILGQAIVTFVVTNVV